MEANLYDQLLTLLVMNSIADDLLYTTDIRTNLIFIQF